MTRETVRDMVYIAHAVSDIFGINSPVYLPSRYKWDYVSPPFGNISVVSEDEAERFSSFGTPVMGSFMLEAGEYNSYDREGRMVKVQMDDFIMPAATIVDFGRDMVMTQTRTLGNTGTVKEIYGLDDWRISIRGICLNDKLDDSTLNAQQQLDELVRWRDICDSIGVSGSIFERKNIRRMVINRFDIRPVQAKWNVIPFEISAVSDETIELAYL